jgi:hypothetical protein
MGKQYSRLQAALDAVGARLKRDRKHLIYELPNGRNFVVAQTPSDSRGEQNAISDLRAVAGVEVKPERRKASADVRAERRRRPGRQGDAPKWGLPAESSPLAAALRDVGLVEQQLRSRIGQLESQLASRDEQIARLEALWIVKAWRWFRV